jgi:hypothetical protein
MSAAAARFVTISQVSEVAGDSLSDEGRRVNNPINRTIITDNREEESIICCFF